MQIGSSPIWTRRNEIWWRRRTWRTEDRESAALVFVAGELEARGAVDVAAAGGALSADELGGKFLQFALRVFAPASASRCLLVVMQ